MLLATSIKILSIISLAGVVVPLSTTLASAPPSKVAKQQDCYKVLESGENGYILLYCSDDPDWWVNTYYRLYNKSDRSNERIKSLVSDASGQLTITLDKEPSSQQKISFSAQPRNFSEVLDFQNCKEVEWSSPPNLLCSSRSRSSSVVRFPLTVFGDTDKQAQ